MTIYTCEVSQNFFGAKTFRKTTTTKILSEQQYRDFISTRSCIDEDGNTRRNEYTRPGYVCNTKWTKTVITHNIHCDFRKRYVVKSHSSHVISNLGSVDNCRYNTGFCYDSVHNIGLTFKPNTEEQEEYLTIDTFNGTIISKHLLIPDLGFSFEVQDEENPFTQGYFRITILGPSVMLSAIDDIKPLINEISRRLEFVENSLILRTARIENMCEAFQAIGQLIRVAAAANPTLFIRAHLNISQVVAEASTNGFIRISHCAPVEFSFTVPNINSSCYSRIPMIFKDEQLKPYTGYLDPTRRIIYSSSPKIDCQQAPSTLFNLGNDLYEYRPTRVPTRIRTDRAIGLPFINSNLTGSLVTIPDDWVYDQNDLNHISQSDAITSFLDEQISHLHREKNQHSSPETHPSVVSKLSFVSLHSLFSGHIFDFCLTWIFRIIVIYLFLYHLKYFANISIPRHLFNSRL